MLYQNWAEKNRIRLKQSVTLAYAVIHFVNTVIQPIKEILAYGPFSE